MRLKIFAPKRPQVAQNANTPATQLERLKSLESTKQLPPISPPALSSLWGSRFFACHPLVSNTSSP